MAVYQGEKEYMTSKTNRLLKSVMKTVYRNRKPLPKEPVTVVRHEVSDGGPMCEVWFMSQGCAYDREGGCVMCNYGKGHIVEEQLILSQLREEFGKMPAGDYNLTVNPSGSFLDEREVPSSLRRGIYDLLDQVPFSSLTIESRADVITPELLKELRERYSDRLVSVEMGVETLDPWLLVNSVNKGVSVEKIYEAVKMVHNAGLRCVANIGLGLPFISERANIKTAKRSVAEALQANFDSVILFPYHIKRGTLLELLHENGRYRCVSLWALAEVLRETQEYLPKVNISWYRNYYTDKTKVISSPDTCPQCRERVLKLFDRYKAGPCFEPLDALRSFDCGCRRDWENRLKNEADHIVFSDAEADFRFIAGKFEIDSALLDLELEKMKVSLCADRK